jgi:hypothetical protein
MSGALYGDGGPDCLAEVPLWQRHLECAVVVPLYAFLAYAGRRMVKASVDEGTAVKDTRHMRSDAWLAVFLAFVLGWEFVCVAPSNHTRPPRSPPHSSVLRRYKLQVGSLIYFINPCHLITAAQIYLLLAPVTRASVTVYATP